MSLFVIPIKISSRLKKIEKDIFWSGGAVERKPHLVNWPTICMEKMHVGLSIRSLYLLNKVLLGK